MPRYSLSLIFYPQPDGRFGVSCPEIKGCFTEGDTLAEATENIRELIADFLPEETKSTAVEEVFRMGSCMRGKIFQEVEAEMTESGEVVFPSETLLHAVGAEG